MRLCPWRYRTLDSSQHPSTVLPAVGAAELGWIPAARSNDVGVGERQRDDPMRCTRAKQSNDAWSERRMQDAVECICSTQLRSDDDELRVYTQYSTVHSH